MAQKWLVNKIIKVLADDELTANQIIERLQDEGKIARNVTRMQVAVLLSKNKTFEKVSGPCYTNATIWRNKNAMD